MKKEKKDKKLNKKIYNNRKNIKMNLNILKRNNK